MTDRGVYRWAAVWIVFCVWCQVVPWVLGAFGELSGRGYLVAFLVSLPAALYFGRDFFRGSLSVRRGTGRRWWKRVRRQPVFGLWLFLFGAALVGGFIYPPTNHDALTYRFPRILHWFWEGKWHWIENPAETQMNLSTHGFEWLMGFLFALTGSDRLFFLVNLVSFALLPGLLFAFLVRVGISGRVASWWMWIFPCGYGLALQAGSIGNDLFAVPYVLAGLVFALRARESRSVLDVVLAILAAALVTGTKLSNAPLALPIAVALAGNLTWVLRWRHASALLAGTALGLIASAAPVMIACTLYTGHFSGDPENLMSLNVEDPAAGVVANSLQVASRNLMPPVNPAAGWWNAHYQDLLPESLEAFLGQGYPRFHLSTVELPQEEGDGLGLGITLLILVSLGGAGISLMGRSRDSERERFQWNLRTGIYLAIAAATFVYLVKMGSEAAPRLMIPYYAVLLAFVLVWEDNRRLIRRRWWRIASFVAAGFVIPAIVLSPGRPLVPVEPVLASLPDSMREKASVKRVVTVYETYAERHDAMAPLRKWLPESTDSTDRIGFIGDGRSLRTGLWRPFGSRKVEIASADGGQEEEIPKSHFDALVVDVSHLGSSEAEDWAVLHGLRVAGIESVLNYAGKEPERYAVLVPIEGARSAAGTERGEDSQESLSATTSDRHQGSRQDRSELLRNP